MKTPGFRFFVFTFLVVGRTTSCAYGQAAQDTIPTLYVFKKIDTLRLHLSVYKPVGFDSSKKYPAMLFFFGGGWQNGSPKQFRRQALYFASRGIVTILSEYRVASRHQTTPFDAVADAKSAVRYVRMNSTRLSIDPDRIVAAGGSAGGHLAAAADLTKLDEPGEELAVSSRPNALVLFNPVFNNGPGEYGYDRIGSRYPSISPFHNIRENAAPTVVFLGTKDKLVSVKTAEEYRDKMVKFGNRCELYLYPDQAHGFFNQIEYQNKTIRQADIFLESLGYVIGEPTR